MHHAETYALSYFARLEQYASLTKKRADQNVFENENHFSIKVFLFLQDLSNTYWSFWIIKKPSQLGAYLETCQTCFMLLLAKIVNC